MNYQSIDEIYAVNAHIRSQFFRTIDSLTDAEATALPAGEKWSIKQIVEHVSIVEERMSKICRKLLSGAKEAGLKNGGVAISDSFQAYVENVGDLKLEAPERVHPKGEQTVADSRAKIAASQIWFEDMRELFKEFDGIQAKFPHPYFGPLSAQDWLVLAGEHMRRHNGQILKIADRIRQ